MFSYKSFLMLGEYMGGNITTFLQNGYELSNFEYSFQQGVDNKGQVSTKVHGGTFVIEIPVLPSPIITEWGLNPRIYKDGTIIILENDNVPTKKIFFKRGACINMSVDYTNTGKSYVSTKIIVHAESLIMDNGIDFDNEWIY